MFSVVPQSMVQASPVGPIWEKFGQIFHDGAIQVGFTDDQYAEWNALTSFHRNAFREEDFSHKADSGMAEIQMLDNQVCGQDVPCRLLGGGDLTTLPGAVVGVGATRARTRSP